MAWSYLTSSSSSNGKVFGWQEILCDSDADIANLPTDRNILAVGSIARVIDGRKTYVLSNGRVWTLLESSDGGDEEGSGGVEYIVFSRPLPNEYECSHTFSEIKEMYRNGIDVAAIDKDNNNIVYRLTQVTDNTIVFFSMVFSNPPTSQFCLLEAWYIMSDNTCGHVEYSIGNPS